MIKQRIDWINVLSIFMYAFIFGVIGMSLPPTINLMNGFESTAFYGTIVSYIVSILLFYLFVREMKWVCERESYIKKLNGLIWNRLIWKK